MVKFRHVFSEISLLVLTLCFDVLAFLVLICLPAGSSNLKPVQLTHFAKEMLLIKLEGARTLSPESFQP